MNEEKEQVTKGSPHWHLDKKFTVGNIMTMLTVFLAMAAWMYKLENRVTVVEQSTMFNKELILQQGETQRQQYISIEESLRRIEDKLDRKEDKMPYNGSR